MNEPLAVREAPARYQIELEPQRVKLGYKQTEAGVVPKDWDVKKLLTLVRTHNSGIYKSQEHYGRGHNILGVSDIYGIDKVDGQTFAAVPLTTKEIAKHTLQCDDLLYGESSLVREGIARTVYVTDRGAGTAFAWHTRRYSIDQRTLQSQYLYYYLQSHPARFHMISNSIQTAITGINTIAYFACQIVVPPIAEQIAISEALSDADAHIESLEQLIAKKRYLKQGSMQELLTGNMRLPGFSGVWEVMRLGDVIEKFVGGGTPSRSNPQYWGNEIPWVTVKDFATFDPLSAQESITRSGLQNSASHLIPKGTLITSTRMALGKAVVYEVDVTINQDLKALFPKPVLATQYLYYWFQYHGQLIEELGSGSTVKGISLPDLKNVEFLLPLMPEQSAIATILSDMDTEIAALEQQLAKARDIKQGMMQELLTGNIRLI